MEASHRIRLAVARVSELRTISRNSPDLFNALAEIKDWQANRFSKTYHDLLDSPVYTGCAHFFLEELYSARDYSQRDAQFAKIAPALSITFPSQVVSLAVTLAELHQATEELDLEMAKNWQYLGRYQLDSRYSQAWRAVGQRDTRLWQLNTVLAIGQELSTLTRKRGLRILLRMMRKPAEVAGLGDLQAFLETGFDRFSDLAKNPEAVSAFLNVIQTRESAWINHLFDMTD